MAALSTALAAEVLSIRMTQLDQADRDQLVRLLLDHAGCGLRGAVLPWGLQLRRWAAPYAKVAGAPLYFCGEQQAPAFVAALVNGGAAHGLELDDTHDESVSHPGAVVISAVLAKAAELNASGDQI